MSPYLQSTVDLYDPNAPWPNSSGVSDQQGAFYSSPSGSSFNLNDSNDPIPLGSSGSLSKSSSSGLSTSSLDLRGSLRATSDPIYIASTEQGKQYLYVLLASFPHKNPPRFPNIHIYRHVNRIGSLYSYHSGSDITLTSMSDASLSRFRTRIRENVHTHVSWMPSISLHATSPETNRSAIMRQVCFLAQDKGW